VPTTEHTINDALADLLRETRRAWDAEKVVNSENTGMLKGSGKRPDILVIEPNVSPVVIETEVLPAVTVEGEARGRLGAKLRHTGRIILSAVAVRLPVKLRHLSGQALREAIAAADDIEMAVYTGTDPANASRWPSSGWIRGRVRHLSMLVQSASVPPIVIEEAVNHLVSGVSEAAGLLNEIATVHPGAIEKICQELRQEDGEQTRRIAATILANAFVFQEALAGGPGKLGSVKTLEQMRGVKGGFSQKAVLTQWRYILKVNYWPIFDIARRILETVPATDSRPIIEALTETAEKLLENRLMRSHDLTGAVFQRLIVDRKFLAAFYTTPSAAALLVGLAISPDEPPGGGSWSSAADLSKLRVADFACGTGTLLSTAYQRIGQLHELSGGDSEALHPGMMGHSLVGCDVLPAAAHLTASMLAGTHPTKNYNQSAVMTVAYGKQPDSSVALGSLDLIDPKRSLSILEITAKAAKGLGQKKKAARASLPHDSFDLIVMNPPFTRATGHEGKKIGVPNPMFAAFRSSKEEQRKMGNATKTLTKGTSAHGNAGEASIFLVLADCKLKKDGGILALVMPLSLMSGEAWENSRALLAKWYTDLIFCSIAGGDGADLSFSADTDIAECLVVGRKSEPPPGKPASERATFVILDRRPAYPMLGGSAAREIRRAMSGGKLRKLEDGPVGGTQIKFGDDVIGHVISAPLPSSGPLHLSRIADLAIAQSAYQLAEQKRIWLPSMQQTAAVSVPITTVGKIGGIGPYHMDVKGETAEGGIRGPFSISDIKPGAAPTYPILWAHETEKQRAMSFAPDSEGIPLKGKSADEDAVVAERVAKVWSSASHCHFNRDFRFNSQSTSMQFTPQKAIGGRAWTSIQLEKIAYEKALVVWANTSLGLLLHWWHANKHQAGRGSIGKSALDSLPVLDVTALKPNQLKEAADIFDEFKSRDLLRFDQIDTDAVRVELDEAFTSRVLGVNSSISGALELLRKKLAREPSIVG
jgi:hypothetical protein